MSEKINICIQPTPNPNALKFILTSQVKTKGKSTYENPSECTENHLAGQLFTIRGVDQLHFYDTSITVSKFNYIDWDSLEDRIIEVIRAEFPNHNPDYTEIDPEEERRKNLPPELLAIEEVLDRTIRPGLQADGGDLQCLSYEKNILIVKYEGACGTCPSSSTGTLESIKMILRESYHPEIEVYIAPSDSDPTPPKSWTDQIS